MSLLILFQKRPIGKINLLLAAEGCIVQCSNMMILTASNEHLQQTI